MKTHIRLLAMPTAAPLLLIAAAMLAVPGHAQNWTPLPLGSTSTIRHFIGNGGFSDVHVVGDGGLLAHSDATRTVWTLLDPQTSVDLFSGRRPALGQVWVSGENGVVRVQSGSSWLVRDVPNSVERFVLYSRESGCQNALGSAGSLYKTCSFGASWDTLSSGVGVSLNHGAGFINGESWIVGDAGTILHSSDGSQTWNPQTSGTTEDLHYIVQAGVWLIVVGDGGTVLRSDDGGANWSQVALSTTANLWMVDLSGASVAWMLAVGDGGTVLKSTDSGATWCQLDPGTNLALYGVEMFDANEYLVGGRNGLLLRTTNGGGSCVAPTNPSPVPALSAWGWLLTALLLGGATSRLSASAGWTRGPSR